MITAQSLLTHTWFGLIGLMLALYVATDGFDLGVGILSLFRRKDQEDQRDAMVQSIGHVWDANETWLVALGGALFGAFPSAYAMLLSDLYGPVMLLIASLIMRGASIEFRHAASKSKALWDRIFGLGSLLAAISQGIILGSVITGLKPGALSAGFIVATAIGVTSGYALLGATWLVKKTASELQRFARTSSILALCATVASAIVVSIGTLMISPIGAESWTDAGVFRLLAALGFVAAATVYYIVYALRTGAEHGPFNGAIALFIISFLGLTVSLFPDLVPGQLSVEKAASDSPTLTFMLIGIGIVLPIMLGYNVFQYRCFKGKVVLEKH